MMKKNSPHGEKEFTDVLQEIRTYLNSFLTSMVQQALANPS